jgi:hypothetical protein
LRYNEVAKLKLKDISFEGQLMKIELGTRKNHNERAAPLYIEKSSNRTNSCPFEWMKRHPVSPNE